ncbi:hypothetical protein JG687_00016416, partial [Phytophthora cactorum]
PGSRFGDGNLIDSDDVCTCFGNINLQDDEEKALMNLAIDEAEDMAMPAALSDIWAVPTVDREHGVLTCLPDN